MQLNRNRLSEFDLIEKIEKDELFEENRKQQLFDFLNNFRDIQIVDQFIKDCPSCPGSTKEILEDEFRSAVGGTLAIEGTILKDEEIKESFEKADLCKRLEKKEQEAENTRRAYKYVKSEVDKDRSKFAYSERQIKQIHRHLTINVQYVSPNVPGQYRDTQASFGYPQPKISFFRSRVDIEAVMQKFINWLNKTSTGILSGNELVKAIMAHYYLTEIHPFGDGNGRTARALESLVLYANNINPYCFPSLAKFWNDHRDEYILRLGDIRSTCDPLDFVIWGIKGYLEQIKGVKERVLKKVKQLMLQDYVRWLYFAKPHGKKINQRIYGTLLLLIYLGKMPFNKFLSTPELKTLYRDRKMQTRYRDFKKMEKELCLIRVFKEDGEKFIEPNFRKLEELEYQV